MRQTSIEAALDDIVDKIYGAVGDAPLWQETAGDIATWAGAVSCSLQIRRGNAAKVIAAAGYRDFGSAVYERDYAHKDVRARLLMSLPADEAHLLHHYIPQDEFLKSEYYNEFFRHVTGGHWRGAASWLTLGVDMRLGISIHRSIASDPDDIKQIRILRHLGPHLRRAGRLHMKLNDIELRLGQLSSALDHVEQPAILVDRTGRVMLMNGAAQPLFRAPHALGVDAGGRISLKSADETRNLRHAIELASSQPAEDEGRRNVEIVVNNNTDGCRLALSVLALGGGKSNVLIDQGSVMLIAKEFALQQISLAALQQAFGLTPAESRLTGMLAGGSSLRQASETLSVSYWTVMTHVKSCYQKTGTHRQAELVALAIRVGSSKA
jgi:DNA-binding CsgD family transcriptional regulator/PAS domain-containing protein